MTSSLPTTLGLSVPSQENGSGPKTDTVLTEEEGADSQVSFLALMTSAGKSAKTLDVPVLLPQKDPGDMAEGSENKIETGVSTSEEAADVLPVSGDAVTLKPSQEAAPLLPGKSNPDARSSVDTQPLKLPVNVQGKSEKPDAPLLPNRAEVVVPLPIAKSTTTPVDMVVTAATAHEKTGPQVTAAQSLVQAFARQTLGSQIGLQQDRAKIDTSVGERATVKEIAVDVPLRAQVATPQTATPTIEPSKPSAAAAIVTDKVAISGDMAAVLSEDGQIARIISTQSTQPAAVLSAVTPTMTSDAARHVASQMAVAITAQNGGPTELALNPPELGRVRLTLTAQDAMIVLMVQAERPETSDMMRRHLDVLSQEFRNLGYSDIQFDFGGSAGAQGDKSDGTDTADTDILAADERADTSPDNTTTMILTTDGGLDLRL